MQRMLDVASTQEQPVTFTYCFLLSSSTFPHVIERVFAKICFPDNNLENKQEINTQREISLGSQMKTC